MATKTPTPTPTISHSSIAALVAQEAIKAKAADDAKAAALEAASTQCLKLHQAGIRIGRKGKCVLATAFCDTLAASGKLAKASIPNYLTTFRKHVESGKPIKDWNSSPARKKGASEAKPLASLMMSAYKHEDFESMCDYVQGAWQDATQETILLCIVDWLKSCGEEFADE